MLRCAVAFGALLLVSAPAAQAQVQAREQGQLVMENVPVTPPEVREALRRYQNTRSAGFVDWLGDGSMLIATRFGQTAQLHRVTQPGGQRTQLTFFDEPVADAVAVPKGGDHYLYMRDVGGAEYYQAWLSSPTGPDVAVTVPKTRNQSFAFSRDGKQLAWAQVTPGSGDYDVMLMTVGDPASRRVIHKGQGAITPLAFSPDAGTLVLGKYISVQSSKRYLFDIASGRLTEIHPTKAEIAYDGGAEFTPDGRAILMRSDEGSEVSRLVSYDLASGKFTTIGDGGRWEVEGFDLSDDGRTLAYAINEDGRSKVIVRDMITRRALPQPELPVGVVTGLYFSQDSQRLAIGLNSAVSPNDVWVWDLQPAQLTRWTLQRNGRAGPQGDGRTHPGAVQELRRGRGPGLGLQAQGGRQGARDHRHPRRPRGPVAPVVLHRQPVLGERAGRGGDRARTSAARPATARPTSASTTA